MSFVNIPIQLNPEGMVEEVFAELEEQIPGWEAAAGNLEVFLIRALVYRLVLPLAQLASDVPEEIFDRWGAEIVNVQRKEAVVATVKSTWTAKDSAGYTFDAGTQVDLIRSGDERYGFRVAFDVSIPPGSTKTKAGEVVLEAIEPGTEGNGLGEAEIIDALNSEPTIELEGESSGGEDAEDALAYLSRLAETMRTLAERPIIADDVAIMARNVSGVARAAVIDNYNAETKAEEQEKTTTIAVADEEGEPCSEAVKEAVKEKFEAKREINFVFYVIDATYNEIDVTTKVAEQTGFDHATVVASVKAALEDFLSPANFGQQPPGDEKSWINTKTLRYQDVVTLINNTEGVDHYESLKIGLKGKELKEADIALSGVAPLTRPGTLTVT